MSLYRRFARAKKGMSTIFGALFFIILILMGFNLMLWGFVQTDAYNTVNTRMNQRDQLALSENLVPVNPGAVGVGGGFNITTNNVGGVAVSIARVYITNIYPVNSTQCSTGPCIAEPAPSSTPFTIANPNIPVGCVASGSPKCLIKVTGIDITGCLGQCSIYKVVLASTRGRLFSFLYPWPAPPPITVNNGLFQTNIGPITVFFDFKSFNFTQGSQTASQGAWVMPTNTPVVIWVKVQNAATDSDIKLRVFSSLLFQAYGAGGVGSSSPFFIADPSTQNPSNLKAYNDVSNPYILPHASVLGPGLPIIVKFGASTQGGSSTQKFPTSESTWIVFIGFYYTYKGNLQGQTIPFVASRTCSAYPAASCF